MIRQKCLHVNPNVQEYLNININHMSESIQSPISSLYTNFNTGTITDMCRPPAIPVRRGVLQGTCLSPLLSNMCFSSFIQFIKAEKSIQYDFPTHYQSNSLFHPVHWFQLADDDAAVIINVQRENHHLLFKLFHQVVPMGKYDHKSRNMHYLLYQEISYSLSSIPAFSLTQSSTRANLLTHRANLQISWALL